MVRVTELIWFMVVLSLMAFLAIRTPAHAADIRQSGRLTPNEYLLRSQEQRKDPIFDNARVVDLSATLGVGSDCGKIDFKNTLQASLKNILDTKYFGSLGSSIIAASPMLLTCYFSPTWCAILKHSQINANWMAQMRLDQCSIVDKYVDSRVEDYYQERQTCVRRSIEQNGGDMEAAMESCKNNSMWAADLTNWAGASNGEKAGTNRLIDGSAKWAGMDGQETKGNLDLVKALVGDTVVSRGAVSVEFGPRKTALTPRTYLQGLAKVSQEKLCGTLVKRLEDAGPTVPVESVITNADLKDLAPEEENLLVDRQTVRSLMALPPKARRMACQKLSDAVAMTQFSSGMNRSLDILTALAQNPNLPENRKQEIDRKRRALKDSIEVTVALQKQTNEPINQVVAQINDEGHRYLSEQVRDDLSNDSAVQRNVRVQSELMNCSDGFMCE